MPTTPTPSIPTDSSPERRPDYDVVKEAQQVLTDLLRSPSDEVRRKAAMDILAIKGASKGERSVPPPTEDELEFIGRVIVETETVRLVGPESP